MRELDALGDAVLEAATRRLRAGVRPLMVDGLTQITDSGLTLNQDLTGCPPASRMAMRLRQAEAAAG
jgi:hypothetical protein